MRGAASRNMALGGVMAALAVVIMTLGGAIPLNTFLCPILCMMLLRFVLASCGRRTAWAWYGCVAILSLLMGPDKEAGAIFLVLGYYPILKPWLDKRRGGLILKLGFFNIAILSMYALLIRVLGLEQIAQDYAGIGKVMTAIMLVMGNVVFWLLDRVLEKPMKRKG